MAKHIVLRRGKERGFVAFDKRVLGDQKLSWKAKGILAYLLSKPEDWEFYLEDIKHQSTDGITAVRSALQELEDGGYLERKPAQDEKTGKLEGWLWIIDELPSCRFPAYRSGDENRNTENPNFGFSHTTNNDSNKKEVNKTESGASSLFLEFVNFFEIKFPNKPKMRVASPKTKIHIDLERKFKSRMQDDEFKNQWRPMIANASENLHLQKEGWFGISYLVYNDSNWRKVRDGVFDSFDRQLRATLPPPKTTTLEKIKQARGEQ